MTIVLNKSTYKPGEEISGFTSKPGLLRISKLSTEISTTRVENEFVLPALSEGSYSIEITQDDGAISYSAIEVIENPWQRIRYGFLSEFHTDVDTAKQVEWAKRLHLTSIQFYDWAYKHETLIAPGDSYADPLGGEISKAKLKELIAAYEEAGIYPSGYVAVYAVDREGWARWSDSGVFSIDGKPFQLGEDFLWVVDPADPKWLPHLINQIKEARKFGFKTFHLDQYGWPKRGLKKDGSTVDIAEQFTTMLNEITSEIKDTNFIFNNVNDFPTWATSKTPQSATYIEVWSPNDEYQDLVNLVDKARSYDPNKPVILSAYLKPFAEEAANPSLELALSVISSRGASHLITGGDGRVLFDPYYVRNHKAKEETLKVLENYHNFITAAGDLLFDPTRVDITRTHAFGVNTEISLTSSHKISPNFESASLTGSVFESDSGLTIQIFNLLDQSDCEWEVVKAPIKEGATVKISILGAGYSESWHVGRANFSSKFEAVNATRVADKYELEIEIKGAWTLIHIPKI